MAAAASVVAVTAIGCGGSGGSGDREPSPKALVVFGVDHYQPPRVRIAVGGRVTFFNATTVPNTAETDGVGFYEIDSFKLDRENLFDIHTLQGGEAQTVEFDTPGIYRFHSSLNSRMRGVVEVVESR